MVAIEEVKILAEKVKVRELFFDTRPVNPANIAPNMYRLWCTSILGNI